MRIRILDHIKALGLFVVPFLAFPVFTFPIPLELGSCSGTDILHRREAHRL